MGVIFVPPEIGYTTHQIIYIHTKFIGFKDH